MNTQELTTLLKKLQTELESGQPVNDDLRASLRQLDQDIQAALGQGSPLSTSTSEETLEARAQALEARFEADHPYLASLVSDLIDKLGKMGI